MSIATIPFANLNASQIAIIIDDTDPSITYRPPGLWTSHIVDISHSNEYSVPRQYGTSHDIAFHSGPAGFNFTFTGVHVVAYFSSNETGAIASCTLDGQAITIEVTGSPPAVQCFNKQIIQYGSHELMVTTTPNFPRSLSFDYLAYVPNAGNISATDLDVGYGNQNPSIQTSGSSVLNNPGNSLDFTFIGYSMGIYGAFSSEASHVSSHASYSIDGDTPVNFTITNLANDKTPVIGSTILVQTPRYSLGQHQFHLEFWGDETTVPLILEQIIVQNITSPHILLSPFPQTLYSKTHLGPIIGGATTGTIIMVLLIFFSFYICRSRRIFSFNGTCSDSSTPVVKSFHRWRTNFQLFRKSSVHRSYGDSLVYEPWDFDPNLVTYEPWNFDSNFSPLENLHPLRNMRHEDSSEQITQPDEGSTLVDLPPTYSTIGCAAFPAVSRPTSSRWSKVSHVGAESAYADVEEEPCNFMKVAPSATGEFPKISGNEREQNRGGDIVAVGGSSS